MTDLTFPNRAIFPKKDLVVGNTFRVEVYKPIDGEWNTYTEWQGESLVKALYHFLLIKSENENRCVTLSWR